MYNILLLQYIFMAKSEGIQGGINVATLTLILAILYTESAGLLGRGVHMHPLHRRRNKILGGAKH